MFASRKGAIYWRELITNGCASSFEICATPHNEPGISTPRGAGSIPNPRRMRKPRRGRVAARTNHYSEAEILVLRSVFHRARSSFALELFATRYPNYTLAVPRRGVSNNSAHAAHKHNNKMATLRATGGGGGGGGGGAGAGAEVDLAAMVQRMWRRRMVRTAYTTRDDPIETAEKVYKDAVGSIGNLPPGCAFVPYPESLKLAKACNLIVGGPLNVYVQNNGPLKQVRGALAAPIQPAIMTALSGLCAEQCLDAETNTALFGLPAMGTGINDKKVHKLVCAAAAKASSGIGWCGNQIFGLRRLT